MSKFSSNNARAVKLTNAQVYRIREQYNTGQYSYSILAKEYGVASETIGRIIRGDSRRFVPEPEPPLAAPTENEIASSIDLLMAKLNATAEALPDTLDKRIERDLKDLEKPNE